MSSFFFKVFPNHFSRPNLHALLHLPAQARAYGSLRNISVSAKEMVHRLHKAIVPHTNKSDVIRDLMEYQREMHGLQFAFEKEMEDDPNRNDGLCELARLGLLNSTYFESSTELLARGLDLENQIETDFLSGNSNFLRVTCHGRPWSASELASSHPHLPRNCLSDVQLTELQKAYEASGTLCLLTNHKVSYYNAVSYIVRDRKQSTAESNGNGMCVEAQKVKIKVGDVIEFLDTSPDSFHGHGFGRVAAVMVHERMVFLTITWIITTGRTHPRLPLREFKEVPLFYFAAFHPLMIIDHPRFVNRTYFAKLDGKLYLNDWVFDMV